MEIENLRALVIGVGIAGERHAKAQKKLGVEVAVFDINNLRAQEVADGIGAEALLNIEEAVAWADVVHICTPDDLHTDYALQSIEAGKTVISEKPMTTNLREAQQIEKAVKKHGTDLLAVANYRLTPTFMAVRNMTRAGAIGQLISLESTYVHDMRGLLSATPWRKHQNFLYGGGIHAVDLAMWIIGEPVVEVHAMTGVQTVADYHTPQDYRLNLKFASGLVAAIWLNARAPQPQHGTDLRVIGELGKFVAHNKSEELQLYKPTFSRNSYISEHVDTVATVDEQTKIIDDWMFLHRNNHDPIPNIHEAMDVMRVMDALERAIISRQTEVVV